MAEVAYMLLTLQFPYAVMSHKEYKFRNDDFGEFQTAFVVV